MIEVDRIGNQVIKLTYLANYILTLIYGKMLIELMQSGTVTAGCGRNHTITIMADGQRPDFAQRNCYGANLMDELYHVHVQGEKGYPHVHKGEI